MKHAISVLLSALVLVSAQAASAQEDVARKYIQVGLDAASSGDTALAFSEFEKARKAAPKMGDPYYYIGRLYTQSANAIETDWRDRRKAEKLLLEALRINPGDPRYLLELARLRLKQHMKVDAGRLFSRALQEAEKQSDPQVLAEVHFNLGYLKELWYRTIEYRRFNPLNMGPPQDDFDPTGAYGFGGTQGPVRYGNEYMSQSTPIKGSGQVTKDEMIEHYRAALPLEEFARGLDLDEGEIETGLFLINAAGDKVVRRTNTETLEYDESPDIDEYRSWRIILSPGQELVAAVEARDAVTWRSAATRESFVLEAYPEDSLKVSDILVADYIKPLVEEPVKRSDYEVRPNAALEYQSGDPVHIYYEIYGLETDSEGFASYDVSIQLRVKSIARSGIGAIIGDLADAWGFSIVGDDRLELQFSREVKMDGRDRVTEYLSLDPQEVPPGQYEIRLRIWDSLGERMGRQLRTFEVVNDEE